MRTRAKLIATVLAAAVATGSMTAPASAFFGPFFFKPFFFHPWFKPWVPKFPHHYPKGPRGPKAGSASHSSGSSMNTGKFIVGCIMGSALGLIWAASVKAAANGQPLRWLTQAEYEATRNDTTNHLTSQQSAIIAFSCGLGAFPVVASFYQQP